MDAGCTFCGGPGRDAGAGAGADGVFVDAATFGREKELGSISCVRSGRFTPDGVTSFARPCDAPPDEGFGMLGMSWVPGTRFGSAAFFVASIDSPATCWNAPRCESALLTASGDTWPPSFCAGGCPFALTAGGGPYGEDTAREWGDAVAAKGFTDGGP